MLPFNFTHVQLEHPFLVLVCWHNYIPILLVFLSLILLLIFYFNDS